METALNLQYVSDFTARLKDAKTFSDKYEGKRLLLSLKELRNKVLAHRTPSSSKLVIDETDQIVENLYQDTMNIVKTLNSVVNGIAENAGETAHLYGDYSKCFWSSVKGEQS